MQHGAKAHDEKEQKRARTARTHLPCASRRWRFPAPRPGTWSSRAPASGRTLRFREQLQRTRPEDERAARVSVLCVAVQAGDIAGKMIFGCGCPAARRNSATGGLSEKKSQSSRRDPSQPHRFHAAWREGERGQLGSLRIPNAPNLQKQDTKKNRLLPLANAEHGSAAKPHREIVPTLYLRGHTEDTTPLKQIIYHLSTSSEKQKTKCDG